ncbi:DUF4249 family protein [Algoriphagus sp.]|uniref:DUF4249 family protein n=1 Tax=Algoriphagus sp. TaxID=1872435 RepID=UPI003295014D
MKRISIILLAILGFSCQEEVDLPLRTFDSKVPVIEAIWTNRPFYNEVSVTLAQNYFDTTSIESIKDAEVYILNTRLNEVIPFAYNSTSNSYRPLNSQEVAEVGERYQLVVNWQDLQFESSGELLESPIVDSLTYQYEEDPLFNDEGYYIKVYGRIPFEENNFYRIRVIENDTLKNDASDYLLFDDRFGFGIFENGLELNYPFDVGDRVRLELYRLNEQPYNYLSQLASLLSNDGGLFSSPPQNPDTNIKVVQGNSDVLGYFNVTSILTRSILIEEQDE